MAAVPDILSRRDYTREEVERMERQGLLTGRYELIEGELINKMGQNPPHARSLHRMYAWILSVFGIGRLRIQLPIEVAEQDRRRNEPQPDVAVIADEKPEYEQRHPRGDELTLIVEVADSSSRFDLSVKARLYARAGVPQYWVLDITRRVLVVHRGLEQGVYTQIAEIPEQEQVSISGSTILVCDLLPPLAQP